MEQNPSKRHHYLPRHYLKGFTGPDGSFFVYDKCAGKIFTTDPCASFFENDLNTVTFPDGTRSTFLEDQYTEIENQCWPSFDKVRAALLWRDELSKKWLAIHFRKISVGRLALGLGALYLLIWQPEKTSFFEQTFGYTWLAIFYSVCLFSVILRPTDWLAQWLRMSWLRSIGIVSYCIYIIHQAVNVLLHAALLKSPPRMDTPWGAVVTVLAAILTYLMAQLSWKFFERPLLKRGHRFKYDPLDAVTTPDAPTATEAVGA